MTLTKFTLSWDAYQKNFCTGLGSLQQNGEFVDMTLAADGHHVRVHQLVLALASPYLKALITSIDCPHPVVFLNKISYKTLCNILEYVYTGEVVVAQEDINSLVEAGQALRIKGLEDMNVGNIINTSLVLPHVSVNTSHTTVSPPHATKSNGSIDDAMSDTEILQDDIFHSENEKEIVPSNSVPGNILEESDIRESTHKIRNEKLISDKEGVTLQYTLSNQGSLQLIVNRFIYYMRSKTRSSRRLWRCVDYVRKRCPASITTKDNVVIQRSAAHIHPFHDTRILKKVRSGAVFTAMPEAVKKGEDIKKNKHGGDTKSTEMDENSASE
ncbi:protein bric-a-brac 1-like [Galleria mellonella]|uniref:Protein bric-a-brac 1-like n=1 Tax=Galleria mellonella TaxID=7137 RepID=A0ABM3MU42_GALME|nr:protein bric-a-brac 1-like [Galleria mellonella]